MTKEILIPNILNLNKEVSNIIHKNDIGRLLQDSATEIGLKNPIISAIFMMFGGTAIIFLFLVIIIHIKYSKLRQNLYGIIFSCAICEFFFCIIYFIHGVDYLTSKFLDRSDSVCNTFSFIGNFLIGSLIAYNIFLIINLLLNRFPQLKKCKTNYTKYEIKESYLDLSKFSYNRIHICSFLIGFLNSLYIYLSGNLGRMQTGTCFIKDNPNNLIYTNVAGFIIYLLLAFIYCDKIIRKNFHEEFPILKKYFVYLFLTSVGWALWLFCLLDLSDHDIVNCISISGGLIVFFGISYYRISCGYVKSILNQESSNRLIAGIMIILCLDNRADPDLYDFRSSFKIKIKNENIIN